MTSTNTSPSRRQPREDELLALDAIRAVEKVTDHEWLPEGNVEGEGTPDLEVTIDGRMVTVEITTHTNSDLKELFDAAKSITQEYDSRLTYRWTIWVSDQHFSQRFIERKRRLKDLVEAATEVLQKAEEQGGTPEEIQQYANAMLSPNPHDPYIQGPKPEWYRQVDSGQWARDGSSDEQATEEIKAAGCDYWYLLDLVDRITAGFQPRHVRAVKLVDAQGCRGRISVWLSASEGARIIDGVDYLVTALQTRIKEKQDKDQMKGVPGVKWLAVVIDGGYEALQLESVANYETEWPHSGLGDTPFAPFDEVWAICSTFSSDCYAVLRLDEPRTLKQRCIVPKPKDTNPTNRDQQETCCGGDG